MYSALFFVVFWNELKIKSRKFLYSFLVKNNLIQLVESKFTESLYVSCKAVLLKPVADRKAVATVRSAQVGVFK